MIFNETTTPSASFFSVFRENRGSERFITAPLSVVKIRGPCPSLVEAGESWGRDVDEIVALPTMTINRMRWYTSPGLGPRLGLFSGRAAPPHPVTLFYSEFTGHGFEIEWFVLAPAVARRPSRRRPGRDAEGMHAPIGKLHNQSNRLGKSDSEVRSRGQLVKRPM